MAEINGRPVDLGELQALALTNYGHFTSFRVEDGRIRGLALHLERLDRDCQSLFGVGLDSDDVRELVRRAVTKSGVVTARVTVFDPGIDLGHPAGATAPQVLVTERPAAALPLPPIKVQSCTYVRDEPEVKSVGLFGSIRRRRIAQESGFDDALFLDAGGHISEGGTWNIGFFDGDQVIWPEAKCLAGVTMRLIRDHTHVTKPVTLVDLPSMEAAFATNAAVGVRAITQVDDIYFPDQAPIFDKLRDKYISIPGDLV